MFIHIGGDIIVRGRDVIAILDINQLDQKNKKSHFTKYLSKKHQIVKITVDDIKSIVITVDKIYFSPISSLTLKKRVSLYSKYNLLSE